MRITDIPPATDMPDRLAKTTITSFRIIEALSGRDRAGVSELAAELDLAKGTVHKHLTTLEQIDYVVKEHSKYRLSLAFLGLGENVRVAMALSTFSDEPLINLAESTGEVASVMVPENGYGIYVTRVNAEEHPTIDVREGERVPLTATAGGKAILAHMPEDERDRVLDTHGLPEMTENTITDRQTLLEELRRIRDTRNAYDHGEFDPSVHCVACPITDEDNRAVGAVTLSGTASDLTEKASNYDLATLVSSTTDAIQNRLLHR